MSENSVIKIHDLHFSYGNPVILEDIQLDIKAKEFVGMVGPNGSGKSNVVVEGNPLVGYGHVSIGYKF